MRATNVKLLDLVQAKQFRLDLYYRLAILPIALPPLRERPEDIRALAEYFLTKLSIEANVPPKFLERRSATCKRQSGPETYASASMPWSEHSFWREMRQDSERNTFSHSQKAAY